MDKRRLRILFNLPNPRLQGGPPTHLPLLARELRKHVDLESFDYGRKTDTETMLDKLFGRTRDLLNLRNKISAFQPHIIHHNTAFDATAILRDAPLVWLAKKYRIPVMLKMHGSCDELLRDGHISLKQLRNSIFRNAACIGVLSPVERDRYLEAWPTLEDRVRVVKNIIKPDFHSLARKETERPTLLFISRFIREKGMFELLEAVPKVLGKFPKARFIFIGSGPDATLFDHKVEEKELHQSVQRIDHIEHLETLKYYATAWALVFPTHRLQEGMPMVVAEAIAAGVPVITTQTKFSESYMTSHKHCLYVDPQNPGSIADAILYLLERSDIRHEMGQCNRELANSFRTEIVAHEFVNVYQEIVANRALA